jgi:hypothetical protein
MNLTVDPGVNAMGFAHWDDRTWARATIALPTAAYVIEPATAHPEWYRRIADIVEQLDARVAGHLVNGVWCEMPILFRGAVGHAAAARGDLCHLAFAVGTIARWAACRQADFFPVPVNEWIGQLPKEVMHRRVRNFLLNDHTPSAVDRLLGSEPSHHWDAIGVGLHAQDFWK